MPTTAIITADASDLDSAIALANDLKATVNKRRLGLHKLFTGQAFHADASSAVSTADAADEASAVALVNALKAALNAHVADTIDATSGQGAHGSADAGNAVTGTDASSIYGVAALLSELRSKFNAHAQSSAHFAPDRTNLAAYLPRDGSRAELYLALNDLKAAFNNHFAAAVSA